MNHRYIVERIMEIIAFVISEQRMGTPLGNVDMDELQRRGYTESEISAALSWILERQVPAELEADVEASAPGSFRILHGIEADMVQPEAWGLLLSYRDLGFLTNEDVEQLLERAVLMGSEVPVGASEIKALIAAYVMHQQPWSISGNRILLGGTDSIN